MDPVILPSGKYMLIIDENGNEAWLERPAIASILVFDGNNAYWADGSDERQWVFPGTPDELGLAAIIGIQPGGRMVASIPIGGGSKILVAENGLIEWVDQDESGIPESGFGALIRTGEGDPASWLTHAGALFYFDASEIPGVIANGTNGQQLTMVGGVPAWKTPGSGSVSTGTSSTGLEGVVANANSTTEINVQAPSFTVSDGATDETISGINMTLDTTNPNGLLGLDVGGIDINTWYYVYIVSDGVTPSAMFSEDPTGPDFTNAAGYTHWGLISLFRRDGAGNIISYTQRGRKFWTVPVTYGNGISSTTALAVVNSGTDLDTIIPPNVKTVTGNVGGATTATAVRSMVVASNAAGLAKQFIGSRENSVAMENFKYDAGTFYDLPILDPNAPEIYWRSQSSSSNRRIEITGYTI